ncbi:hypothetical protein ABIB40_000664 [Pedobacter sp. UYP30]|uniref:hypothetical protein n=1 Tax=Pedobacter sp. UYP30 TaxID=1756400 RepID=UPI0033925AA7
MILPLKYKPVNWIDGMKISSGHFVNTDQFIQDINRDTASLFINKNNFGLLPPFKGETKSLNLEILARASNHLHIKLNGCNAINSDGMHISIGGSTEGYTFDHYFKQDNASDSDGTYFVILSVNPFDRIASGVPDPDETPLRYPEIENNYKISIVPAGQINGKTNDYFEVGKFVKSGDNIQIDSNFIPACTSVVSHPALIGYYENFGSYLNEFQLLSFRIIDKITSKENISPIGKNVKSLCDSMVNFVARIYFSYRNDAQYRTPVFLVNYFSEMAHLFFTSIKSISGAEREELLKYFYEWKDVTPGNFEELLSRLIEHVYQHHDIQSSMQLIDEFMKVMIALWTKLSSLEYIGQRKENIVVAEQQMKQQTQARKTWTLLD